MGDGQQLAAHTADDACVADAYHGAAMGVGEGRGVDLEGAWFVGLAAVGACGLIMYMLLLLLFCCICGGLLLEVGKEERVWRELGEGLGIEGG